MMAGQLFAQALPAVNEFTSPRAWAFALMGIHEYLRRLSGDSLVNQTREALTSKLMGLLGRNTKPDWCWFEDELSYDNAKLAHALIVSGRATGQAVVFERGLHTLRWLNELQAGKVAGIEEIAAREGRTERSVNMTLSLAFLAPDIVAAALSGRLPRGIGLTKLTEMPPLWSHQRAALSRAA